MELASWCGSGFTDFANHLLNLKLADSCAGTLASALMTNSQIHNNILFGNTSNGVANTSGSDVITGTINENPQFTFTMALRA
jgi:hypothetical protein